MTEVEISTVVRNYVVSFAGIFIGGWTFWKWGFSEWLRNRKEGPAIDGNLVSHELPLDTEAGLRLITIEAIWRNRSVFPVYIDNMETRLDIFLLDKSIGEGPINTRADLGDPRYRVKPYEDMDGFILEPETESKLQNHLILKAGGIYLARWKLYRSESHHTGGRFAWTRELVIDLTRQGT